MSNAARTGRSRPPVAAGAFPRRTGLRRPGYRRRRLRSPRPTRREPARFPDAGIVAGGAAGRATNPARVEQRPAPFYGADPCSAEGSDGSASGGAPSPPDAESSRLVPFLDDTNRHLGRDFAMHLDGDPVLAQPLQRVGELNLAPVDLERLFEQRGRNVGAGDRSVQGIGLADPTRDDADRLVQTSRISFRALLLGRVARIGDDPFTIDLAAVGPRSPARPTAAAGDSCGRIRWRPSRCRPGVRGGPPAL